MWKRPSHLHLAERGPLSPKQSEGIRVAFQEAGGCARPGSHPEKSEFRARSGEVLSRVLSMGGHNRIYFHFLHPNF